MDSTTHTIMQGLVQRASAPGSLAERGSYYKNDGHNDPPMSPTAKWKGGVHAYEDPVKDPNRFPYLPHPYPLKRKGRAHTGHPGGFLSLQPPRQPPKFPDEDQIYMTYSEWWHAQRPGPALPDDKDATFSTSYWPYGRRISCVASMDKEDQFYNLDKRVVKNHTFYKDRRASQSDRDPFSSASFTRSRSSAELLGSQAEHFGYHRSLGRTFSSHASASFHEKNPLQPGEHYAATTKSGKNMWESMQAQASSAGGPQAASQRAASAPSTSRSESMKAAAGSSRYDPQQHLRNLGLGQRTHAEWCLPQPQPYANH